MFKGKFIVILMLLLSLTVTVFSAPGDVAGNIYSTDIVTYLNGATVTSYNIGGKTCIDAEILNWHYGFDVYWYEDTRKLTITDKGGRFVSGQAFSGEITESVSENPGIVMGNYYETDIVTTLNGKEIESYNIGGRTFICAEAMADFGYDVKWNEEDRTLKISKPMDFYKYPTDYGTVCSMDNLKRERDMFVFFTRGVYVSQGDDTYMLQIPSNRIYVSPGGVTYVKLSDFVHILDGKCSMEQKTEPVYNDYGNGYTDTYEIYKYIFNISYDKTKSPELVACQVGSEDVKREDVKKDGLYSVELSGTSVIINGDEYAVKAYYGGKEFDSSLKVVGEEVYIPAYNVGKILGYDLSW